MVLLFLTITSVWNRRVKWTIRAITALGGFYLTEQAVWTQLNVPDSPNKPATVATFGFLAVIAFATVAQKFVAENPVSTLTDDVTQGATLDSGVAAALDEIKGIALEAKAGIDFLKGASQVPVIAPTVITPPTSAPLGTAAEVLKAVDRQQFLNGNEAAPPADPDNEAPVNQ